MNIEPLIFECPTIKNKEKIPVIHTGRGQDISPEFLIKNLSPHAKTLAITLEDIKHPIFKAFTHWLIWNIPANEKIPGAMPHGRFIPHLGKTQQGIGYGCHKYAGPKPPKGQQHLYCFTIYALDCEIEIKCLPIKCHFIKKAKGHIIQQGSIIGEYE